MEPWQIAKYLSEDIRCNNGFIVESFDIFGSGGYAILESRGIANLWKTYSMARLINHAEKVQDEGAKVETIITSKVIAGLVEEGMTELDAEREILFREFEKYRKKYWEDFLNNKNPPKIKIRGKEYGIIDFLGVLFPSKTKRDIVLSIIDSGRKKRIPIRDRDIMLADPESIECSGCIKLKQDRKDAYYKLAASITASSLREKTAATDEDVIAAARAAGERMQKEGISSVDANSAVKYILKNRKLINDSMIVGPQDIKKQIGAIKESVDQVITCTICGQSYKAARKWTDDDDFGPYVLVGSELIPWKGSEEEPTRKEPTGKLRAPPDTWGKGYMSCVMCSGFATVEIDRRPYCDIHGAEHRATPKASGLSIKQDKREGGYVGDSELRNLRTTSTLSLRGAEDENGSGDQETGDEEQAERDMRKQTKGMVKMLVGSVVSTVEEVPGIEVDDHKALLIEVSFGDVNSDLSDDVVVIKSGPERGSSYKIISSEAQQGAEGYQQMLLKLYNTEWRITFPNPGDTIEVYRQKAKLGGDQMFAP